MGLLLDWPLRLLGLIFALLRVLIPIALIVFFIWLWRRQRGAYHSDEPKKDEPHFKGPSIPWTIRRSRTIRTKRTADRRVEGATHAEAREFGGRTCAAAVGT